MIDIFLTVDVEHSIGGAFTDPRLKPVGSDRRIFGRFGGKVYGIPLLMDIAESYGLRLTFFLETCSADYFGLDTVREVCSTIVARGHDVQLHLHPEFLFLKGDEFRRSMPRAGMAHLTRSRQRMLIEKGILVLQSCGVPRVAAFRAGGYGANIKTLKALSDADILIDSSYNFSFVKGPEQFGMTGPINDLRRYERVYEFPVTQFVCPCPLIRNVRQVRPFDINGAGFLEMRAALKRAALTGPCHVTVVLHSFSFIKAYDLQYQKVRPRWNVIRRFEKLCLFLAENPSSYRVRTFGELSKRDLEEAEKRARHEWPYVSTLATWVRLAEQAVDRWV